MHRSVCVGCCGGLCHVGQADACARKVVLSLCAAIPCTGLYSGTAGQCTCAPGSWATAVRYVNGVTTGCTECTGQLGCDANQDPPTCSVDRREKLVCKTPATGYTLKGTNNEIPMPTSCAAFAFGAGVVGGDTSPCFDSITLIVTTGSDTCNIKCGPAYNPNTATVTCASAAAEGDAPSGSLACTLGAPEPTVASGPQFSDTGNEIVLTYNSATNMPGPACSAFLDAPTAAKLGYFSSVLLCALHCVVGPP